MKNKGLISLLITAASILPGCLEGKTNNTALRNQDQTPKTIVTTQNRADEIKKRATILYWKCKSVVGEEKIDHYDMLVFGIAYRDENNPLEHQKEIEELLRYNFKNKEIQNKKAYEICEQAAEVIRGNEWKNSTYLKNWGCLKETYEIIVTDKPQKSSFRTATIKFYGFMYSEEAL